MTSLRDFDLPTTAEWPPISQTLAEGRWPRMTRRGWRAFWAWRREQGDQTAPSDPPLPDNERAFIDYLVEEALAQCETSQD